MGMGMGMGMDMDMDTSVCRPSCKTAKGYVAVGVSFLTLVVVVSQRLDM